MPDTTNEPGAAGWEAIAEGWAERQRTNTDQVRDRLFCPCNNAKNSRATWPWCSVNTWNWGLRN